MTENAPKPSWDGKTMTPVYDHLYGRPASAYGDAGPEHCPEAPPVPCLTMMEETAHAPARKVLQTLLNVDVDDAGSVEPFLRHRRRHRVLHKCSGPGLVRLARCRGLAKVAIL